MKKIAVVTLIVAILGTGLFVLLKEKKSGIKFRTEKVVKGEIEATVTATGTVNPVTTVLVGTQVSGTIKHLYADFNSSVKKGELIALIDPDRFEADVEQSRANLISAKANVEKSEALLTDAKVTMERKKELFEKGFGSKSDFDTAEANYNSARAQLGADKARVAQAAANLRSSETNLMYTKILSPVDGIVISRNVDVGQTVAATFQTPTLFTIAEDLTKMQIDSSVDEADIGKIQADQPVKFTVDAYPDITFEGKVTQIRNAPVIVQNVVTYDVVVKVDNSELKLKPGMTANISIIVANKKDVLKIPNVALRFRLPENGMGKKEQKGYGVWILDKEKPMRITVSTGISDGNYTELLSGEIKEGRELIVESLMIKPKDMGSSPIPRMR